MPDFIVTTIANGEEMLAREVSELLGSERNIETRVKPGQVSFNARLEDAYTLCLKSRLANRVLLVLAKGKAENADDLYALAYGVDWPMVFSSDTTFSIHAKGTNKQLKNTQFIAQKVKDAVSDAFVDNGERRPFVDKSEPQIAFQVRIHRDFAHICLDLSLKSLHLRSYRTDQGDAPLKENVAALLVARSGWLQGQDKTLYDPMCGSGTLLIEAALAAKNVPPNLARETWGFDNYLGHKKRAWQAIHEKSKSEIIDSPNVQIIGSDISHKLVDLAKQNAINAGVGDIITFKQGDALQQPAPAEQGFILSNPPYGERLNSYLELLPLYYQWGKHLKAQYASWQVSLICSEPDLLGTLKLRASKKYAIKNGALDCTFNTYELSGDNLQSFNDVKDNNEFANRIQKNKKRLKSWLKKANTNAYRLYDADLPNYNFAIDVYADWVIVQEYQAPKSIPEAVAKQRLQHAILALPELLDVKFTQIAIKVRQRQRGQNQYTKTDKQNIAVKVNEKNAEFWINPVDYLDVGLFLDHRITRQMFAKECAGKDVLNLFCYTGSVSVHAALHNARTVTSVDMSKSYLDWAKRNFELNNINGYHRFEQGDCIQWVKQAIERPAQRYDRIFVDPPSFSNSKRMDDTWDVQRDHFNLLKDIKALLKPEGKIYFSNNLRGFKLDDSGLRSLGFEIQDITQQTIPEDFARNSKIHRCWVLTQS